jgi:hypothetical protein
MFALFLLYLFMIGNGEYEAIVIAGSSKDRSEEPTECCFNLLYGIVVDEKSHVCFVSDSDLIKSRIRKITFVDD